MIGVLEKIYLARAEHMVPPLLRISCVSGIVFLLALGMLFIPVEEARANTTDNVVSGAPQLQANAPNSQSGGGNAAPGTPIETPQSGTPQAVSVNAAPASPAPPPQGVAASPIEGASESAGRFVGGVSEPAGGVLGGIAEPAGETVAPVAEGAGIAVETVAAPVGSASEPALGMAGDTVGGVVEPVARTTAPVLEPVVEEVVSPAARTVDELASSAVGPVAEGAAPIMEPIGETVGHTATPLVEPLAAPVGDAVSPVAEPFAGVTESDVEPAPIAPAPSPDGHDERPIADGSPSAKPAMDSPSAAPPPETVNAEHSPIGGESDVRLSVRPVEAAFAEDVSADDVGSIRAGDSGATDAESMSEPTKTTVEKFEASFSERVEGEGALSSGPGFVPVFDGVGVVSPLGEDIVATGTASSSNGFAGGFSSPLPTAPSGGVSSASSSGFALELGVLGSLSLAWFGGRLLRRGLRSFRHELTANLVYERPG